jgi:hypothetical protein
VKKQPKRVAATIINGMKPHSIGRTLGIGLRVAGRIASQRAAGAPVTSNESTRQTADVAAQSRAAGQVAGKATRGVARGVGGFLRPFRRVGGILWLEVTGVFFFLPVVVFTPTLWRTRASFASGPDHRTFLVTAGVVAVFLYLSVSSFWRARRR